MPLRFLKDETGCEIFGHNKKKLRYDIKNGKITLKYAKNWTDYAKKILMECYENCEIICESKSRGRPKVKSEKQITRKNREPLRRSAATTDSDDENIDHFMGFEVDMRVKSRELPELGIGVIIKLETYVHAGQTFYNAHIDFKEEKGEILNINTLVKARGRKPSKNKTLELKKNKGKKKENCEEKEENLDFEILNINGELYLMNNQKEVMSLSGSYIGWYRDGGIV
jgi:hypothetical protein